MGYAPVSGTKKKDTEAREKFGHDLAAVKHKAEAGSMVIVGGT